MSSPQSPQKPKTLLGQLTQAVNTIQARVDFSKLTLKPNAKVPKLLVHDAGVNQTLEYPLLAIAIFLDVVLNPVISSSVTKLSAKFISHCRGILPKTLPFSPSRMKTPPMAYILAKDG